MAEVIFGFALVEDVVGAVEIDGIVGEMHAVVVTVLHAWLLIAYSSQSA